MSNRLKRKLIRSSLLKTRVLSGRSHDPHQFCLLVIRHFDDSSGDVRRRDLASCGYSGFGRSFTGRIRDSFDIGCARSGFLVQAVPGQVALLATFETSSFLPVLAFLFFGHGLLSSFCAGIHCIWVLRGKVGTWRTCSSLLARLVRVSGVPEELATQPGVIT